MKKLVLLLIITTSLYLSTNNKFEDTKSYLDKNRFIAAITCGYPETDLHEKLKFYEHAIGYRNSKHGMLYISYKDLDQKVMKLIIAKYAEIVMKLKKKPCLQ